MINLTFLSPLHLGYGRGFERWVCDVALRLKSKFKYDIKIVTSGHGNEGNIFNEVCLKSHVELPSMYVYPNPVLLRKVCDRSDIIYVNASFAGYDIIAFWLKKALDAKVVVGYHGTLMTSKAKYLYWWSSEHVFLRAVDAHHALNEERYRLLRSRGIRNAIKIPNGVDVQKFIPKYDLKVWNPVFKVLFVGALTYGKGIDLLWKVIAVLNESGIIPRDRVEFLIAGRGPWLPLVKRLSKMYNNVKYLGRVEEKDLVKLYQEANVFISLPRWGYEEFHLTPLEALACGTPVVVSNIPGPREYAMYPMVMLVDSHIEAVKSILKLYNLWANDQEEYLNLSKRSRRLAEQYDLNKIVNKLHKFFQMLLET